MNAGATTRMFRFAWVLLVAVLAVGVLAPQEAGANPNRPYRTISRRVGIQTTNCKEVGGTIEVTNTYGSRTNGHQLISSKTTCTGGALDGMTCTNTKEETNCTQPLRPGAPSSVGGPLGDTPVAASRLGRPASAWRTTLGTESVSRNRSSARETLG